MFEKMGVNLLKFCLISLISLVNSVEIDPMGYVVYCPCMGRFGNQADHFLGSLGFANKLNRTLVLPAWIEYRYGEPKSIQVPFDTYFKVEPLKKFHKVVTMEVFMEDIAPYEWPASKRVSFCYMARGDTDGCNAKDGNPFGPFWDTYGVDFVGSEFFGPLHYDISNEVELKKWLEKYAPSKWPVLAFSGSPASFPVSAENKKVHKYLKWSDNINKQADDFIKTKLPKGAFIGVHLRNGIDWVRACQHIPDSPNLFSAPQCLGYRNENGKATMDMCLPTKELIIRQLKRLIKTINNSLENEQNQKTIKSVFVASDNNHMIDDLQSALKRMKIVVVKLDYMSPHVDLAILGKANHFIGNCISSFSAFVKRERDANGFSSSFWAYPAEKSVKKNQSHEEL